MHPLLFWFASGLSFFPGVVLILIASVTPVFGKPKRSALLRRALVVGGVFLIVLSATPLSTWVYTLGLISVAAMAVGAERLAGRRRRLAIALRVVAATFCLAALVIEAPYHRLPAVPMAEGQKLYVIGDSISAGLGEPQADTWSGVLSSRYGVDVVNLAVGGARIEDAIGQAAGLGDRSVIVLEIGGNNMLEWQPVEQFRDELTRLSRAIAAARSSRVIVVELPLSPLANRYGAAQREAVKSLEGGVILPKRILARILTTPEATTDGIHLSPLGHAMLAEAIWQVVGDGKPGSFRE